MYKWAKYASIRIANFTFISQNLSPHDRSTQIQHARSE